MAQLELLGDGLVTVDVGVVEVIQQPAALTNHHQQSTTGTVVFLAVLQVLRQMVDALRQQSNLHVGRTGILLVQLELFNRFGFGFHTFGGFFDKFEASG